MSPPSPKAPKAKPRRTPPEAARRRECRAIFAALSEFVDGTLNARDCRELQRHFQGCKPCVEYLKTLEKTIGACQGYRAAAAPPPSASVRQAFTRATSERPIHRRREP